MALGLLSSIWPVTASLYRLPVSPSYVGGDPCPERCSIAGPDPANWPVYQSMEQLDMCDRTMFYVFNIHDMVDETEKYHRIYACSSRGADWATMPPSPRPATALVKTVNASFEVGWSPAGAINSLDAYVASEQLGQYLSNGHGNAEEETFLFGRAGSTSFGIYVGKGLSKESVTPFALRVFQDTATSMEEPPESLSMQLCNPSNDGDYTFGLMASGTGDFASIQEALQTWSKGKCLSSVMRNIVDGPVSYASYPATEHVNVNTTNVNSAKVNSANVNSTISKRSSSFHHRRSHLPVRSLARRGDCKTVQVASGDSCGSLAEKCGISPSDFTKYNPDPKLCSSLMPGQHVCCSSGSMPDFSPKPNPDGSCKNIQVVSGDSCGSLAQKCGISPSDCTKYNSDPTLCSSLMPGQHVCCSPGTMPDFSPKPNPDGSCATYTVSAGDNCASIGAKNSLTNSEIESFNKNTWGWTSCDRILAGSVMCLSKGKPPMPSISQAIAYVILT